MLWSRALYRATEADDDDAGRGARATAYQAELLDAIRAHPSVGPMTANPLMLTELAVVHWSRKKLPEQRGRAVRRRRRVSARVSRDAQRGAESAPARVSPGHRPPHVRDPSGVRRTISRAEAAASVAPLLGVGRSEALAFLEDEELHSGIVVSRTEGEVEFWHLTFQEYLAALGLSVRDDYWSVIESRLHDDRWAELLLLLAGCRPATGAASGLDARHPNRGLGRRRASREGARRGSDRADHPGHQALWRRPGGGYRVSGAPPRGAGGVRAWLETRVGDGSNRGR